MIRGGGRRPYDTATQRSYLTFFLHCGSVVSVANIKYDTTSRSHIGHNRHHNQRKEGLLGDESY